MFIISLNIIAELILKNNYSSYLAEYYPIESKDVNMDEI